MRRRAVRLPASRFKAPSSLPGQFPGRADRGLFDRGDVRRRARYLVGMARKQKLNVYRTPIGFHDAYVAAPSQHAALLAWGRRR